jgi:hypothetical protein
MNKIIQANSSFQLPKKSGKVLLITGTSVHDQLIIAKYLADELEFVKLNQEKIFNKIALEISEEYFIKDIKFAEEITGKIYPNYLYLLSFLQKTNIAKLSKIYQPFYRKAQLANEIIIFRLYKEYFREAQELINSGKNCIIIENIFNDPFPRRKEIFFDYFNSFGDSFKILNVYSSMQNCISKAKTANFKFISYVCSNHNIEDIYDYMTNLAIKNGYNEYRLENPLFNFEQYPLMFNISNKKSNTQIFEIIKGKDLKRIYNESIFESKKIFGFTVLKSYPIFYQRPSIMNEIGLQFLHLKDFLDEDEIYISNKRLIYNLNLILDKDNIYEISSFTQISDNIKLWIQNKDFRYHSSDQYINKIKKVEAQIKYESPTQQDLSFETLNTIKKLIPDNNLFIINDIYNKDHIDGPCSINHPNNQKYIKCYYFLRIKNIWVTYVVSFRNDNNIKLEYFHNAQIPIEQNDENLIFINYLYLYINKLLNRHFYIKITLPKKKDIYKKMPYLEEALFLLNKKVK